MDSEEFSGQNINRRVVALSLVLHDVGWSRLSEEEIASSLGVTGLKLTETAQGPKEKHAVEGARLARTLLSEYTFEPPLATEEIKLICLAVLYHDKPEEVAGADVPMPIEVQLLVDLDHIWSFTHENFWQDTVRKGVPPETYWQNLQDDLDSYFVTETGKDMAHKLLEERGKEIESYK